MARFAAAPDRLLNAGGDRVNRAEGAADIDGTCAVLPPQRRDTEMIRFLLRFLGLWILAAAFVWLVIDGTKSIAGNALYVTKLGKTWYDINPNSLLLLQPAVERHITPWLWNPVIQTILEQPTWLVLGVIGSILILLGRKKKKLIGYGRD